MLFLIISEKHVPPENLERYVRNEATIARTGAFFSLFEIYKV